MYAEIGRLAMANAAIDTQLTLLLSRLMSGPQDSLQMAFPSVFMFSARTLDQRFEIVRKSFSLRLDWYLQMPRHENAYRASSHLERCMSAIFKRIRDHKWIRNTVVHGSITRTEVGHIITPNVFDHEAEKLLAAKGDKYRGGLHLELVKEATIETREHLNLLAQLGTCLAMLLEPEGPDPSEFEHLANQLGKELGLPPVTLRDVSKPPPQRGKKRKKGSA